MARNKKVEILSNDKEVLHPMTDGDCVIFEDGQTLAQKLSEDDSVKYTPVIVNSSPMFKVGEGNTVDYSDNVLDGAYERATLQGQTYVNYIQESSADEVTLPTPFTEYERTQHNTLTSDEEGTLGINLVGQSYVNALQHDSEEEYVVLGESLEFQEKKVEYTNEGQIKSAMLKGQTLVNLVSHADMGCEGGIVQKEGDVYTLTTQPKNGSAYALLYSRNPHRFKTNTRYLLQVNVIENNLTTSFNPYVGHDSSIISFNEATLESVTMSYKAGETGIKTRIFTTKSDFTGVTYGLRGAAGSEVLPIVNNETIKFKFVFIEYQEGMENWDIPYFEGMQSVTVSTRLENKLGTCTVGSIAQYAKSGKTFTTTDASTRQCILYSTAQGATNPANLKPNTEYIIGFKISNLVLDGLSSIDLTFSSGTVESGNCLFTSVTGGDSKISITSNGTYRLRRKTTDLITSSLAVIKGFTDQWEKSGSSLRSMTISEIMYVEYQNGMENWNLPYFEDYQVMKPVQIETTNRNLFYISKSNKSYHCDMVAHNNSSFTLTGTGTPQYKNVPFEIDVKPNTDYYIQVSSEVVSGNPNPTFDIYSMDNKYLYGGQFTKFNSGDNTRLSFRFYVNVNNSNTGSVKYTVQLEESSTATSFVPHQSKTTYSWDEVILRKIGDVEDTLDLTTGEWVQRIGEIKLIDQKNIGSGSKTSETWFEALIYLDDYIKVANNGITKIISNKLPLIEDTSLATTSYLRNNAGAKDYIVVALTVEDMGGLTGYDGWHYYVKNNDVVIQYELETPIVHKVNLSRPNLQVYDDITHVHTKCLDGTLVPNIYLPSDISYPAILEPGKKYNVCVNHTEVSADNPLKVNVGGTEITMTDSRMTLTTPTTLANSNVSFTGKGNKIKESMLIKNSSLLTRDLPHFNGIGSVQLGKTIENLCESRISSIGTSTMPTWNLFDDHIEFTTTSTGSRVIASKLLKPLKNGKKYFVYAPNNYPTNVFFAFSFSEYFNNGASFTRDAVEMRGSSKYAIIEPNQKNILYREVVIGNHGSLPAGTYKIDYPIICEYEPGMEDWDWESIGYFTGMKNIGNEFMRISNKNLFDGIVELGGYTGTTGEPYNANDRVRSINKTYLKPGVYYLSSDNATAVAFGIFNIDGTFRQEHAATSENKLKLVLEQEAYAHITVVNPDLLNAKIQLEEASSATSYVAHKHNSLHILPNEQIPLTFEQGAILFSNTTSFAEQINNAMTTRIRTGLLDLEPNETYRISFGDKNYICGIAFYDNSNIGFNAVSEISKDYVFTTTKDVHKICINIAKSDMDANITPSALHQVRLEKVTDVTLRSVGDVYDELDITRGIYTQRIGEIVLDGDELWSYTGGLFGVGLEASANIGGNFEVSDSVVAKFINNRYNIYNVYTDGDKGKGITLHAYKGFSGYVFIRDSNFNNVNDFKTYLQKNPIIIHYVLGIPIVHQVHIGNKNEANTEVAKPNNVFTLPTLYAEQTHIDLTNNGIVPKVQSRDYIAYPVLPMIGRTYTLQHNLTGGVSNLTIDLLGRTQSVSYQNHKSLIYSPETMDAVLHNELRISGKGKISRVMYIDGGYMDRDIPYIEGMKNAVNPIVKNVGRNLFDGVVKNGEGWWDGKVQIGNFRRSVNLTPVKPNTEYVFKLTNRYGIGCGANFMAHGKDGKFLKYIGWVLSDASKFTTPSDCYYIHWYNDIDDFTDFYIEEVSTSSQYEPYKENICYVDCGEIRLTPDMFEQGGFSGSQDNTYEESKANMEQRYRIKELCKVEPNTTYNIRYTEYDSAVFEYGKDEKKLTLGYNINKSTLTITTSASCHYLAFNFVTSTLPTQYVSITKVSEIKQMRSLPNGVHDEIDLETGKYIQRVGEITFDGTESWLPGYASWSNKYTYYNNTFVDIKVMKGDNGSGQAYYDALRCPQLHRSYMGRLASASIDGVCSYYYSGYQRIFISKQDCATVDELKLWLQENPITVQYELPEPIVKDIVIHNYPHSYEGGHVIIENGDPNTPIPAQLTYRAVTNRSGQIQQHTEQVEKQEKEINELETLILANIHLSQTR